MLNKMGFVTSSEQYRMVDRHMLNIAVWMQERNWKVILFCVLNTPTANQAMQRGLTVRSIQRQKKYNNVVRGLRFSRKLRKENVQLLFLSDTRDVSLCGITKYFQRSRLRLVFLQGQPINTSKNNLFHTFRLSKLDAWITPLNYLKYEVLEKTNIPARKIHVIPMGVNLEALANNMPQHQAEARKKLNLPLDKPIIGILGLLDPKQGQDFLIHALSLIRRRGYDVHLMVMGDEPTHHRKNYLNHLKQIVSRKRLEPYVHFRPYADAHAVFFKAIDIFAVTAPRESCGTFLMEAMGGGLPVIASNAGAIPEIMANGKYGLLYQPQYLEDFARKIIRYLQLPHKAMQMGKRTQDYARDTFSHHETCRDIEHLIHQTGISL